MINWLTTSASILAIDRFAVSQSDVITTACPFRGMRDNLVIYDYHGNHLWTLGNKLNAIVTFQR